MDRRTFLASVAAGSVALPMFLKGCAEETTPGPTIIDDGGTPFAFDPDGVAQDDTLFPIPAQSGAVRAESVILTALAADGAAKTLRVWRDSEVSGEVILVKDEAITATDGYLKTTVDGLRPGTWYSYAFFAAGAGEGEVTSRTSIGRFTTAWGDGVLQPIRVAATACTNHAKIPFPAMTLTAERDFDVLCHLGDMVYADGSDTTEEFRQVWITNLESQGYRDVLSKASMYLTLDDHEVTDSGSRYDLPPDHYQRGLDAMFEVEPIPRVGVPTSNRLWDSYRWGDTAEFFVLDCRTERKLETFGTDDPIYVSKDQLAWLKQALSDSPCVFKIVLTSVPILGFPGWPAEGDRWEGYAQQRDELLDHITDTGIGNVWFLTGDFHMHYVARLEPEGPRSKLWEIMVGPGGPSFSNPLLGIAELEGTVEQYFPANQFAHFERWTTATWLTFDPEAETVTVVMQRPDTNEVLYEATLTQDGPV